jgi:hypothetical protein
VARRCAVAMLAVLALLGLSGCTAIRGIVGLQSDLRDAGYRDARVGIDSANSVVVVTVTWRPHAGEEALTAESHGIAALVWQRAEFRFDAVETVATGLLGPDERARFDREALAAELGPRPPGLDKALVQTGEVRAVLLGVVGAVLAVVLVIVLVVVLVLRSGRKKRRAGSNDWPGSWPQQPGGWPHQPGGWPDQPGPPGPPPVDPGRHWRVP